jgi:hypothetical protein
MIFPFSSIASVATEFSFSPPPAAIAAASNTSLPRLAASLESAADWVTCVLATNAQGTARRQKIAPHGIHLVMLELSPVNSG